MDILVGTKLSAITQSMNLLKANGVTKRTFSVLLGIRKKVLTMSDCKWMQDEICVNADCPMCCDFCPVADVSGVCRFEEREGNNG